MEYFGNVIPFSEELQYSQATCRQQTKILTNPAYCQRLQLQLAIAVDVAKCIVSATYLEVDGEVIVTM